MASYNVCKLATTGLWLRLAYSLILYILMSTRFHNNLSSFDDALGARGGFIIQSAPISVFPLAQATDSPWPKGAELCAIGVGLNTDCVS